MTVAKNVVNWPKTDGLEPDATIEVEAASIDYLCQRRRGGGREIAIPAVNDGDGMTADSKPGGGEGRDP